MSLTVLEQEGAEDVDTVTLNIQSSTDTLHVLNAGVSHQVFTGQSIISDGIVNTTVAASKIFVFSWLNVFE